MIAIDTNVLLRYLLDDDQTQSTKARELIASEQQVLITDAVLVETIWVLKGKRYNLNKESIIAVIYALFEETNICFENEQTVWRAIKDYKNSSVIKTGGKRKEADFPDALIVNKTKHITNTLNTDFKGVYTFDVAALQILGTKTL